MAFTNPLPRLLGMDNSQPDPYQTLLGGYYTPQQARMAWVGGTLQGLGAGLASGKPGAWAQGMTLGGSEGLDNYRKRAVVANQIAQSNADNAWQTKARARQEQEWASEDATSAAVSEAISGIQDPQMRLWAQMDPKGYFENQYGPRENKSPASIQEYQYAVQQGFKGSFMDYQASKKGNGITYTDAEGNTFQIGGTSKPLTEGQSKDTVYATRAEGALPYVDAGEEVLADPRQKAADSLPFGVGNYLTSGDYQVASSAGKEFLQALLRKDTGATIQPFELQEYGSVYLPQPGDKPDVKKYKREARARALAAMKAGMPPQAIIAQEKALIASSGVAVIPPADASSTQVDGFIIRKKGN